MTAPLRARCSACGAARPLAELLALDVTEHRRRWYCADQPGCAPAPPPFALVDAERAAPVGVV